MARPCLRLVVSVRALFRRGAETGAGQKSYLTDPRCKSDGLLTGSYSCDSSYIKFTQDLSSCGKHVSDPEMGSMAPYLPPCAERTRPRDVVYDLHDQLSRFGQECDVVASRIFKFVCEELLVRRPGSTVFSTWQMQGVVVTREEANHRTVNITSRRSRPKSRAGILSFCSEACRVSGVFVLPVPQPGSPRRGASGETWSMKASTVRPIRKAIANKQL